MLELLDEEQWEVDKNLVNFKVFDTEEEAESFEDSEGKIYGAVFQVPSSDKYFRAYTPLGELGVKSIREAGKKLGINLDLDGEYQVGRNWAETH